MSNRQGCLHADEEQLRRERAALRSRESAFVQRSTEQDIAVTAEEARLVEQARGLDLQRAELENAEAALQAQRTQAQLGESSTAPITDLLCCNLFLCNCLARPNVSSLYEQGIAHDKTNSFN